MDQINKNNIEQEKSPSETSRQYALFYSFFLIPLMIAVFWFLFHGMFLVITKEPNDINQLLIDLENGSSRDRASAAMQLNASFLDSSIIYETKYQPRIKKSYDLAISKHNNDEDFHLAMIMTMGNTGDQGFEDLLIGELQNKGDQNRIFRVAAIEALGKLRSLKSKSHLISILDNSDHKLEQLAALGSLGNLQDTSIIRDLSKIVSETNKHPEILFEASLALLKLNYTNEETIKIINNLLDRQYYQYLNKKYEDS